MVPAPVARVSAAAAAAAAESARGAKSSLWGLEKIKLEFPWKEVAPIRPDGYSIRSVDSKA